MNQKLTRLLMIFLFAILAFVLVSLALVQPDQSPDQLKQKYVTSPFAKTLKLKGVDIDYIDTQVGEKTLVLLHGLGGYAGVWDTWIEHLRDHFRVIAITLPGFGLTGPFPTGAYSLERYIEFLATFVGVLEIERFYLVGHDFGGTIAAEFAAAQPMSVEKLVLIAPFAIPGSARLPILFLSPIPGLNLLLEHVTPKLAVRGLLNLSFVPQQDLVDENMVETYYDLNHRRGNRAALNSILNLIASTEDLPLSQIICPVLILWGQSDRIIPAQTGKQVVGAIVNANLIIYKGIGHMIMNAIPRQSARDTLDFLNPSTAKTIKRKRNEKR